MSNAEATFFLRKQAEKYEHLARQAPPGSGARKAAEATLQATREVLAKVYGDPEELTRRAEEAAAQAERAASRSRLAFFIALGAALLVIATKIIEHLPP